MHITYADKLFEIKRYIHDLIVSMDQGVRNGVTTSNLTTKFL